VASATFFALRGALNRTMRDILKPIYFTARDAASVPASAGLKPLPW